jgi:hypothetical protein
VVWYNANKRMFETRSRKAERWYEYVAVSWARESVCTRTKRTLLKSRRRQVFARRRAVLRAGEMLVLTMMRVVFGLVLVVSLDASWMAEELDLEVLRGGGAML